MDMEGTYQGMVLRGWMLMDKDNRVIAVYNAKVDENGKPLSPILSEEFVREGYRATPFFEAVV